MIVLWIVQLVLVAASVVLALVAARMRRRTWIGAAGIVPITLGALLAAFDVAPEPPTEAAGAVLSIALAALGVVGGSAAASVVLDAASQRDVPQGAHGGIMILARRDDESVARTEVLRGGAAIGYLERVAIVAAIVVGHLEIAAAVIAIKGLGRFSELDSAEARERFIIGTLASMIWAGACAALIVLPLR